MKAIVTPLLFALSLVIPAAQAAPNTGARKFLLPIPHKPVIIVKAIKTLKTVTYLGVETRPVDPALRSQLDLPKGIGLLVAAVAHGSPADKAGVKAFDVLHKLDNQLLVNAPQLVVLIQARKPGSKVTLTLIRKAKPLKLAATLGSRKVTDRPGVIERLRRRIPWDIPYDRLPKPDWRMPKMPKMPEMPDDMHDRAREFLEKHLDRHARPWRKPAPDGPKVKVRVVPKSPPKKHAKPDKGPSRVTLFTLKTPKYTVTVRGVDGHQTATVTGQDGKVLHKDVPTKKWNTLPEDIQKLLKGIRIEHHSGDKRLKVSI